MVCEGGGGGGEEEGREAFACVGGVAEGLFLGVLVALRFEEGAHGYVARVVDGW